MENNVRLIRFGEEKNKKIITVGIVSERVDSYQTIIHPNGCTTPMQSVLIDYNHNRISTGASVVDLGIQDIDVELNGKTETIKSRVVEIHVHQNNRAWTRENKDNKPEDVQSMYDLVENGRIGWVSVDFSPSEIDSEYVYSSDGTLKRVEYRKWSLNYISLLDVKAGQDDSFFIDVRAKNLFNISKNKKMEKRMYLGDVVQSGDGVIGVVSKVNAEIDGTEKKISYEIITTNGDVSMVNDDEISDDGDGWNYANQGILLLQILKKIETNENVEEKKDKVMEKRSEDTETIEEEKTEVVVEQEGKTEDMETVVETTEVVAENADTVVEDEKRMADVLEEKNIIIREKEIEIEKLKDTQRKLVNSPVEVVGDAGSAMLDGENAKSEATDIDELRLAKVMKI